MRKGPAPDRLRAVIFDVDGTLAETERDGHRVAFNRAFERLGLADRWDETLYGALLRVAGGRERLAHYFDVFCPRPPADPIRLAARLHRLKTELFVQMLQDTPIPPRPGVLRLLDELAATGVAVAIATTGSRAWVTALLPGTIGDHRLARIRVIVTGEDVVKKKPDPEAYELALRRLGVRPDEAVAVEDSENGLRAARGAGLACLAVPSHYSASDDFTGAHLVVDELGDGARPLRVLRNPCAIPVADMITAETLRRLGRISGAGARSA